MASFIDEITFHLRAGRGGNGVVRWLHEKGKEWSGAAGGNGGNGGSVYARGVRDYSILAKYRNKKEFAAKNGVHGMKKSMYGANGDDFYLDLPIGSIITRLPERSSGEGASTKNRPTPRALSMRADAERYEILHEGETILLLKGGRGGLGNEHFKASTNTTPWEHTDGKIGEEGDFAIELQLIVDAGLVGFPNAGKSSLLNAITNTSAKVGSYAFTTLEPNLGDFYGFIVADIPGLIEGASHGRGLGDKFLRHIARTKIILHCISLENCAEGGDSAENDLTGGLAAAYKTIRDELEAYGADHPEQNLAGKQEVIVLTKTDLIDEKMLAKAMKEAGKFQKFQKSPKTGGAKNAVVDAKKSAPAKVLAVSVYDDASVKAFGDSLVKILRGT